MNRSEIPRRKVYGAWINARGRCYNLANAQYKSYGERGIKFSEEFLNFETFYEVMGDCPKDHVLDRTDNNGPYSAENCRWVTKQQSAINKRPSRSRGDGTLPGVRFRTQRSVWIADACQERLYYGIDFFEACCRRKSWEAQNQHLL